ncbi:MAG: transposase [Alphaproteobacteria bacterium]|nr:transposase [Alphaproteobacteria bacterium]MBP7729940.1 transposase [Alphaproteobacteria bacterium]
MLNVCNLGGLNLSPLDGGFSIKNEGKNTEKASIVNYHLVWVTKYRKPVLYGEEAQQVQDVIRKV